MANPLKWHGGKSYLASWVISLMPDRASWHLYREPYFGGGAVLFRLDPEGLSEAVNDLNAGLTNFWAVLGDDLYSVRLIDLLSSTPFSQAEFDKAGWTDATPSVHNARDFFIRYRQSRQGLGKDFATPTRRLRRGMNENVSAWLSAVEGLPEAHERLKRVEIRNMDAVEFIRKYDDEKAVFYCDPPYLHETRSSTGVYEHEMTESYHRKLLACLTSISGQFLLSGYRSKLYDRAALNCGWNRHEKQIDNKASGKKSKETKTECIWTNF